MHYLSIFLAASFFLAAYCQSEEVVWSGVVSTNGSPTTIVKMDLGEHYQFKVSGVVSLGEWWQNKEKLSNDACFEYSPSSEPNPMPSFQNSMNIKVCQGKFNSDHIYLSNPFVAAQSGVHFWVHDRDYEDNTGEFKVEIIHLGK